MIKLTQQLDGSVDIQIKQGTSAELELTLYEDAARTVPLNLADYSAKGQYKKSAKSTTSLIDFVCVIPAYHASENPGHNKLRITITPASSNAVTVLAGEYDILIYKPADVNVVEVVLEGKFTIDDKVTDL